MKDRNERQPGIHITKLGSLVTNRNVLGKSDLPVFSVTMNEGMVLRNTLERKMAPDLPPEKSLFVEKGDIVYNMMRMWQGAVAVCKMQGVVSPAYVVCRPNSNIDSLYAYYLFKSSQMLHKFKTYSYGITGDRLRLYYKDFALVPVKVLPFLEQKIVSQILSTWDRAIEGTRKLIDAKKRLKKALMQQLLTGKSRLKGFVGRWKKIPLNSLFNQVSRPVEFDDSADYNLISVRRRSGGIFPRGILRGTDIKTKNTMITQLGWIQ
ncbi:MAG: restriction endonuclease subunit S [Desulfobacterales bacterium]|nr:restriction endonuclease subunit S [Desulfobacterales bacterium]